MTDEKIKLIEGALLHDIGKVVYRQGDDRRKHSQSGYDYLKETIGLDDVSILNAVRYHHYDALSSAHIEPDDNAYITYIADNISSATDRREKEGEDTGFEISTPLQSVFNILNGNNEEHYYSPSMLNPQGKINYPHAEKVMFDEHFYTDVLRNISDNLKGIETSTEYINSLMEVLEANLSYVPSSTAKGELADISLYDHVKLTAAIASCIREYLQDRHISNYKEELMTNAKSFYEKDAFVLFTMDISGIQNFIYTIASKNALKTLRTRSFYLEILMEHMIDGILDKLSLSRANLIYSGGGHCYMLLPNVPDQLSIVDQYMQEINEWLLAQFQTALYVGWAYTTCSSNALKNEPVGSYGKIFEQLGIQMSEKKASRYSAAQMKTLNNQKYDDYTRECAVCKRIGKVDDKSTCEMCNAIEEFSKEVLYGTFFTVIKEERKGGLKLPDGCCLIADTKESLKERMESDQHYVRTYAKNEMYTGKHVATRLWVGSYTAKKTFSEMADTALGIRRLAILRADVDNLGHAFVAGFKNEKNQDRYVTISRTASLSRQLSLFFKLNINKILEQGTYSLTMKKPQERQAAIVYSGGDDLFIVGAWNDVIELAVDIQNELQRFTQGTLTISAGIGLYDDGYPISASAREVEYLENASKKLPGKSAITLLPDGCSHISYISPGDTNRIMDGTYSWTEFMEEIIGEKYKVLRDFFDYSDERGKGFLYRLLELIRSRNEKINFARYVYMLSRLEPNQNSSPEERDRYQIFSRKMYEWIRNEKDCIQLKTAMNLYTYITREREE